MDLTTTLLCGLTRLTLLTRAGLSRIETEAPAALLGAALGGAAADPAAAFDLDLPALARGAARARLSTMIDAAQQDPTGRGRLAMLAETTATLLLADGILRAPTLGSVELRLNASRLIDAVRVLSLGGAPTGRRTLLIGSLGLSGQPLELPLGLAAPLEQLALVVEAGATRPRLRTQLWVGLPPDPDRRRLADWPAAALAGATRIELYRKQIPGQEPAATIVHETVALPRQIDARGAQVWLGGDAAVPEALRTTIYDMFQSPLVVVERLIATR